MIRIVHKYHYNMYELLFTDVTVNPLVLHILLVNQSVSIFHVLTQPPHLS